MEESQPMTNQNPTAVLEILNEDTLRAIASGDISIPEATARARKQNHSG